VEALPRVAELAAEEGVGPVGAGSRPEEERVLLGGVRAEVRRRALRAEAVRRLERPVVQEVAEDVRPRRLTAVPLGERPVRERLDDVVPLAVERRGGRGHEEEGDEGRGDGGPLPKATARRVPWPARLRRR